MQNELRAETQKLHRKHRLRRIWLRVMTVMACMVVAVTTYALILPAITLEAAPDTYCGLTEHVHTDVCYQTPGVPAHTVLSCAVHVHTEYCYDVDGVLICGHPEYDAVLHTHNSFCFDTGGELMCTLPERSLHTHREECYDADGGLICGQLQPERPLEHIHTAECLTEIAATEPEGLLCELPEHTHTEACMTTPDAPEQPVPDEEPEEPDGSRPEDEMLPDDTETGGNAESGEAENSGGESEGDTDAETDPDAGNDGDAETDPDAEDDGDAETDSDAENNEDTETPPDAIVTNGTAAIQTQSGRIVTVHDLPEQAEGAELIAQSGVDTTAAPEAYQELLDVTGGELLNLTLERDGQTLSLPYAGVSVTVSALEPSEEVNVFTLAGVSVDGSAEYEYRSAEETTDETGADSVTFSLPDIRPVVLAANATVDLSGVTVTVTDEVVADGCFRAGVTGLDLDNLPDGAVVTFKWYRQIDGNAEAAVNKRPYLVNGRRIYSITGAHRENVDVALSDGGITDGRSMVTYRAVLCLNGVPQEAYYASISNLTYNTQVLNGSFENPVSSKAARQYSTTDYGAQLKWQTTDTDKKIEIVRATSQTQSAWTNSNSGYGNGTQNMTWPKNGNQYAEINAEHDAALYQTVLTIPGDPMNWKLSHAKRPNSPRNEDTMYLCIMPESIARALEEQEALNSTEQIQEYVAACLNGGTEYSGDDGVYILRISDGLNNYSWSTHSGVYNVPEGEHLARFFFISANVDGYKTMGNFLDDVWFTQYPIPADDDTEIISITKEIPFTWTGTSSGSYWNPTYTDVSYSPSLAARDEALFNLEFDVLDENDSVVTTISGRQMGTWTEEKTVTENDRWSSTVKGTGTWRVSYSFSVSGVIPENLDSCRLRVVEREDSAQLTGYTLTVGGEQGVEKTLSRNQKDLDFTIVNSYVAEVKTYNVRVTKIVDGTNRSGTFRIAISYESDGLPVTQYFDLENGGVAMMSGIPAGVTVTVSEPSHDGYHVLFREGDTTLLNDDTYSFVLMQDRDLELHNTAGVVLPETGGGMLWYLLGGAATMLSALAAMLALKRRWRRADSG